MSPPNGNVIHGDKDHILTRPLILQLGPTRISIPVYTSSNDWIAAEILREEFLHTTNKAPATIDAAYEDDYPKAEVILFTKFLYFTAAKVNTDTSRSYITVLHAAASHFTLIYLKTRDVHSLTASYETSARNDVLTGYFAALSTLENNLEPSEVPRPPQSALLAAAASSKASIYALFGGQGTNEVYFNELQTLHDTYKPYVAPLLVDARDVLVSLVARAVSDGFSFYSGGLDVLAWLDGSSPRPSVEYLASIPVSFPLIGLTQLTQYLVSIRIAKSTPGDMRDLFSGATGHSQGIVSAVVMSASNTFESFSENVCKALRWLFYCGLRGQEAFPVLSVEPSIVQDAVDGGEGIPSPMLGVTGLPLSDLEAFIAKGNAHLPGNSQMQVSLHNGPRAFVVTGPSRALYGLVTSLRKIRAPSGLDQGKVPFSQRKAVFSLRFLVVNVPYHSQYLKDVTTKVAELDLSGEELWTSDQLKIPVYHTEDGSNLNTLATSVTRSLCDQIFTSPIHWTEATRFTSTATHAIDFGPGGLSGIGTLTARNLDGRGIRVIIIGEKSRGDSEFYDATRVRYEQCWRKKFAPRLVKTSDGNVHIDTSFSRLLGKPPIMVAGMTPSTVKAGFVSAILSAGYHTELAGGGHYSASAVRAKVAEIQSQIPAGVGISLNSLYINPRQFGFQFPLWMDMRKEGLPIEGFCVAAGIPTTEKAAEIISGLRAAGIKHVSFKPGSVDGIRQVVSIAAANQDFPIILQWTGGRAGGHHSCEDFHQPILATYGSIRQQANIVLIAGSGFGGAEDFYPYLTGEWSVKKYGMQAMPYDGLLLASRVMVAKEAHTSPSVKDLIVAAAGVDDEKWEGTYTRATGGILTVRSELGEPIHKIATRGVKLWKEFDDTVFSLPKEKRAAWLQENRDSVISKLNKDFAKPWFCEKKDGSVVHDLGDMTYEEVALRLVRLMFVAHQSRWIDVSLRNLLGDWLRRVEERFAGVREVGKASILQSYGSLDDPMPFLGSFFKTYPDANMQLLASEDKAFFLAISQRSGQKPVPFIPILDTNFEVWFKKDSLWASEDIDAVFDQDPQRVCILQGPVAVKHSIRKDEPIGELLGNVESALVKQILADCYQGDDAQIPTVDYIGCPSPAVTEPFFPGVERLSDESSTTYKVAYSVPDASQWLEALAGPTVNWLRAFLTSAIIVQGTTYVDSPIRRLFAPRLGQTVAVKHDHGSPSSITLFGGARSFGPHQSSFKAVEAAFDASSRKIFLTIFEDRQNVSVPLSFEFDYRPEQGYAPIHEAAADRNKRIKTFYWKLWFGDDTELPEIDLRETFFGPEVVISAGDVERFCSVVGNQSELFKSVRNEEVKAPMDFAIVTGWQAIMQAIFPASVDGDILKLVHLSNAFRMMPGARSLQVGDVCRAEARIVSVTNSDSGKTVKVKGSVRRGGESVIEVTSAFLYRGRFTDYENTFETIEETDYLVDLNTEADVGVLQSKEWFQWEDTSHPLRPRTSLLFKTQSEITYKDKNTLSAVVVTGAAYVKNQLKQLKQVAVVQSDIQYAHGNVVLAYLQRHGQPLDVPKYLEGGGYTLTSSDRILFSAPRTNEPYSIVSGDYNPIHVNPYFSDYASLPGTITHGMWSSAATRKYVESVVGKGHPERVLAYDVTFVGMVLPGDSLEVKIKHVGMHEGNLLVKIETFNDRDERVLEGSAEVAQPTTAYVFTGQGSQEPGMGMELYNTSPAARAVWENADAHLRAVYGFSIIDVVKNNPKDKTVHFGGVEGQAIRQRYMEMSYDTMDKDGNVKTLPLFADIDVRTPAYTFSHPGGLLFATQFAQIALVVTEKAAFEDMRSKGVVPQNCAFAGHSLGEYSALASIADVLPISSLVDVVFYRGITMQRAVERDAHNRSNYAMCAVNPSRISKTFNDAALREVVDSIARRGSVLLEIVNFNVEGQQYVCAGELVALQTLTNVLNFLKVEKVDVPKLTETFSVEKVREMLQEIVDQSFRRAQEQREAEGYIQLERGFATIPLPGIDVPFHSRYLWAGVLPFRAYLSRKINPAQVDPDMLIGRYIPNLTAEPFDVTQAYAQRVYDQTSSPRLDKVLKHWDRDQWGSREQRQKLTYVILVELLSYQFASPVRWIETQDRLFSQFNFERLIELGPGPTLTGMATRTWKAKYELVDGSVSHTRAIFCHAKHAKEVYYNFEDEIEATPSDDTNLKGAPAPVANVAVSPAQVVAVPSGPAMSIPDEPLKAVDTLRVIVAQKLKKKVEEIPLSKSIKDLVGGKSTLQNEILGDLQVEFVSAPDKGEELPLDELGSALASGYSGTLGKHTSGMVSRLVGGKMPGGFNLSVIKAYLSKTWGLGPGRVEGLLLLGVTLEPAKRLGSEAEAKAWLDSVASAYSKQTGISLSSGGAAGAGSGAAGTGGAVINSEEFLRFQTEQERFASQLIEVYMRHLNRDSRTGERAFDNEKATSLRLQERLDSIAREHGDTYIDGIQPIFEPLKARHFDSSWNWVRQDALLMWYDIIHGRLTTVDREITARCISIMNRADPALLEYMQYHINTCDPTHGETYKLAKEFGQQLIDNCREAVGQPPLYKDVTFPTAPHTEVTAKGDIVYTEVVRENVRKLEAYVEEMASGDTISGNINIQKVQDDVLKLWNVVKSQPGISQEQKGRIKALYEGVVRSLRKGPESRPRVGARNRRSSSQFLRPQITGVTSLSADKVPLLHLKRRVGTTWEYSSNLTSVYLDILTEIATSGTTFKDKNALLTGVGKGSIGVEVLKGLLSGGAHVVVTTSRYSRATVEYYQDIYQKIGARGSALTVVPFNQGSKQDVEALIDYIYASLSLDLDYILPFAAVPENGREIDGLDDKSELAHRIMLVNVLRLLGAVKTKKASRQFVTRPTQVILPLSPNHGLFGNDGLYSESKISLETLFNRWNSESWGEYLCLAGAVIGWTRGTGVMGPTNIVAHQVESHGVRTFSAKEMAFNLLGLMHPLLFSITQVEPIWADLNGGMDRLPDLAEITTRIRLTLLQQSDLRRAIARDNSADFKIERGLEAERVLKSVLVTPRANYKFNFPELESIESSEKLSQLRGIIDLERVIVVTGFAEVGPWGSSRTRWEMEAIGEFTIEGCIEMAWIMGYIKHFNGRLKDGSSYVGWVDIKTGEPVDDKDVKGKYEKEVRAHAGIRLIEPELNHGYDPKKKVFLQEIELTHDLEPLEVSEIEARNFKLEHGDNCDIWAKEEGQAFVKLKKGALIKVPKALHFDRLVAGQIPTGWNAGRYGIPEEIIAQTDRTALWALVCAAEALIMSGITDPYELYKYVHPSEVGTSLGSGMGGMSSLAAMFKDRREEVDVQKDILQETFINTVAGWVNMLLLSSSGPIKIPVGACATGLQSVDIACETILSGKAKVMIAGGFDDFSEEGSFEFANMKATSNSATEFAAGREPTEFSRPTTSTRAGFMESQGCGVQVLMNAKLAIEMGAPIRGIIAFTSTATDKAGRSVPAPGRGVVSIGREMSNKQPAPILDIAYRSRQLAFRRAQISQWIANEHNLLREEVSLRKERGKIVDKDYITSRQSDIEQEATRQEKDALMTYGMLQGADPRVAPLRRALAVWGLNADDIGVISIHGTSTMANESNETHVYNDIFTSISRTRGNAIPIMAQKSLTGHSKGGSAAWQMNGLCQTVNSGIIPGNRNADNIDKELRQWEFLMFPSKSIHTDGINAGLMTSFGFGQVGGSALVVHPRYLIAALEPAQYETYKLLNGARALLSYKSMTEMMTLNALVKIKDSPPYTPDFETPVLLNPLARTQLDKSGRYSYPRKLPTAPVLESDNLEAVSKLLESGGATAGVGVDQELISAVPSSNSTFVSRNFTAAEIKYCQSQPNPAASFAARWTGKEAVFKALGVSSKGAAAEMKDIEILPDSVGVPKVHLHGDAKSAAEAKSISTVLVSLSHSDTVAIAFATAQS